MPEIGGLEREVLSWTRKRSSTSSTSGWRRNPQVGSHLGPPGFCIPGGRLKLHPGDLMPWASIGVELTERWFNSTTKADNGPGTPEDEGLSYIAAESRGQEQRILLKKKPLS